MKRRVNHTQRKRITREHIRLSLRRPEDEDRPLFDLALDLSSYEFPPSATIRVEARRGYAAQRWFFGTVAQVMPPPEADRRITEVDDAALFRILVVASDGSGRLLGHADRLRPVQALESLLHLRESDALGAEVWRVEFDDSGGQPVLLINGRIEGIRGIVTEDPSFYALVIPEVLRTVLTEIVVVDPQERDDDSGGWHIEWLDLASRYVTTEPPYLRGLYDADDEKQAEARDWINHVVGTFAEKTLNAASVYKTALDMDAV